MYSCGLSLEDFFILKITGSLKNLEEKKFFLDFLGVSESVSVHGIQDLSAGRTRTVRVRYAHPHSAGFLEH